MTFAQLRLICSVSLFVCASSYDYEVDKDGVPILWQSQKGLLFNPVPAEGETYADAAVADELSKSFPEDNAPVGRRPHVIAFHAKHDASIAFSIGGRVQCILELERLFEKRYFTLSLGSMQSMRAFSSMHHKNEFRETWKTAVETFLEKCECDSGTCPRRVDYAVLENFEHREFELLKDAVGPLLGGSVTWRFVNHHRAHALLGFYTSPFRSAIIMSYDGGGNDGVFNFYLGAGLEVKLVAKTPFNMGMAYNMIALLLPEVTGATNPSVLCSDFEITPATLTETVLAMHELPNLGNSIEVADRVILGYAGKFMGYSALTNADPEVQFWARQYIISYLQNETGMDEAFTWLRQYACRGTEAQRILAASTQAAWTDYVEELFWKALLSMQGLLGQPLDGIVLTGGCSLNVLANQRIFEKFTERATSNPNFPRSLYVPPGSNDGGIVVGSLWSVMPPLSPQPLQYLGFRLFDEDSLEGEAASREAQRLSELGGIEYLADLLAGGEAWKNENEKEAEHEKNKERNEGPKSSPIIAVVIGRQEFGPRALGHRSLLAVPTSHDIKDRMNQLKARQSYRPVAPMIADEALEQVFGQRIESPYMTMAPLVLEKTREKFPGLAHVDGTARHQSVGAKDEPWIHALLLAVGRKTGLAALINTSFNSKGKPIVNTVRECLKMLDELPDLDFVLIEDWLFRKRCLLLKSAHSYAALCIGCFEREPNES